MLKAWIGGAGPQLERHWKTVLASPALVLIAASCVPAASFQSASLASPTSPALPAAVPLASVADQSGGQGLVGNNALIANAALPVAGGDNPAAAAFALAGATGLDRLRALDCMAQAIYYEAGNESEEGQRAVAQVVLNRVRHPAWPNSVCGVVYQGPMRAGGGCQFTFTCDGSLARRPGGEPWAQARRLAAEALAGRTYAPVGLSTHYHANYVFPHWAPRLAKTTQIGAHIFYRLPGILGRQPAFRDAYAGREPFPRPTMTLVRPAAVPAFAADLPASFGYAPAASGGRRAPRIEAQDLAVLAVPQPDDNVREEYRSSGQWRADSPIAPPGR
ncbi:MAG TPA: cell wall hydrolase [Allosphingosinicella sp.]|nr:cell wall hydrolase [Allosphingosinicella sp.]